MPDTPVQKATANSLIYRYKQLSPKVKMSAV
jgi:hypothetical protein